MRVLAILLLAVWLGALGTNAALADGPRRLVATELCADQWLLQLAEPRNIAALSYQAARPSLSVYAEDAQNFAQHDGSAEAILALKPDFVLAGAWTSPRLLDALARLGVPSRRVPAARALSQWQEQVRALADVLQADPKRRAALLAQVPPAALARQEGKQRPRAAIYHAGGYSSGAETLAHDMVEAAGAAHMGAQWGAQGWVHAPLERLLAAAPQLLILDAPRPEQKPERQLAGLKLRHAALRRLKAQTPVYLMPEPAWLCLTPRSFLEKETLARFVQKLARPSENGAFR